MTEENSNYSVYTTDFNTDVNTETSTTGLDNLSERAMLATLELSSWSGRCIDDAISEEVVQNHAAEKDSGRFSKRLINKDHLKNILSICNEARKVFKDKTLAWSDRKARLLPSKLFSELSEKLADLKVNHSETVDLFLEGYNGFVEESRNTLGGMFKEEDYPTVDELKQKFAFTYGFDPLADPKDFRCAIDEELKKKIQEDIRTRTEEKYKKAMKLLCEKLYAVMAKFNEKLSEKGAKFKNSLVNNIADLVNILPEMNLTNDPKLAEIAEKIKQDICVFDPEELRHDEQAREKAVEKSKEVMDTISNIYG